MGKATVSPTRRDGRRPAWTRRPLRAARLAVILGAVLLASTACSTNDLPNWGWPDPITIQGHRIIAMWKGSAVAALAVGVLVWGLILWCVVAYRKRTEELPDQVHYNLPIEVLYTILPFVIISVLFYFTARDETYIDKLSKHPAMKVNVVGFKWAWQFNYLSGEGSGLSITGRPGEYPQLVIPTGRTIQFVETSPDVIHSWWVPAFGFKRDVIPGRENKFEVTLNKTGTFDGRCAELCGAYHDRMLFTVRVVTPSEYTSFLAKATKDTTSGRYHYAPPGSGS